MSGSSSESSSEPEYSSYGDSSSATGPSDHDALSEHYSEGDAKLLKKVLNAPVSATDPVLARRKNRLVDIRMQQHEEAVKREMTRLRRELREWGHVVPTIEIDERERRLRKTATKGVLKILVAINRSAVQAQRKKHNEMARLLAARRKARQSVIPGITSLRADIPVVSGESSQRASAAELLLGKTDEFADEDLEFGTKADEFQL